MALDAKPNHRHYCLASFCLLLLLKTIPFVPLLAGEIENSEKEEADRTTYISLHLAVVNNEKAMKEIILYAQQKGGYMSRLSATMLTIKIPRKVSIHEIVSFLDTKGIVSNKKIVESNNEKPIRNLKIKLSLKEKHFAELAKLVSGSNLKESIELEKEMVRVTAELEEIKGELQYLISVDSTIEIILFFQRTATHSTNRTIRIPWIYNLGNRRIEAQFDH